jgi:catechol 2,3-dioxygenase-like lactoylglutathione lyase family enzyme
MGQHSLELNVNRFNKALAFYKDQGFQVVRDEKIDIGRGYFMDDHVLRKVLGTA